MSLVVNYRSLLDKQRKMNEYLRQLNTSAALDAVSQKANRRTIPTRLIDPLRPSMPKDQMTEEDAYYDLASRLRPYMKNNNEVNVFLERLRTAGRLREFLDTFVLFAKDYLVGVSRLGAATMFDLYGAFASRKLTPQ